MRCNRFEAYEEPDVSQILDRIEVERENNPAAQNDDPDKKLAH
jgi:hypothetical protein